MIKRLLAATLFLLSASCLAQSSPGFYYGFVPTAGQWNLFFTNKFDYTAPCATGGVLTSNGSMWSCQPSLAGGTVTTVSVVTANGFAGTVATASATPAITITETVTGVPQGNGTAYVASAITAPAATAHLGALSGSSPALTSCGTGSPAIVGTDIAGTVTEGTSASGCVITFNIAYTAAPHCAVSTRSLLAAFAYTVSTTAITLTNTTTSGDLIDYVCAGI